MITQADISELKSLSRNYLSGYPSKARLKGTDHDITFEDFRVLAIYEATITLLNRKGFLESTEFIEDGTKLDFEPIEGSDRIRRKRND
jgi:hypothetical protein